MSFFSSTVSRSIYTAAARIARYLALLSDTILSDYTNTVTIIRKTSLATKRVFLVSPAAKRIAVASFSRRVTTVAGTVPHHYVPHTRPFQPSVAADCELLVHLNKYVFPNTVSRFIVAPQSFEVHCHVTFGRTGSITTCTYRTRFENIVSTWLYFNVAALQRTLRVFERSTRVHCFRFI